jgi:hypothetical protein
MTLLKPGIYGVDHDDRLVSLYASGTKLPMTWDTAIRMAAHIRVAMRRAQDYESLDRELRHGEADPALSTHYKGDNQELPILIGQGFEVDNVGPLVVIEFAGYVNGHIRMPTEIADNVWQWLATSGIALKGIVAPEARLQISVADLTLEHENQDQARRTATSAFN